MGMRNVKNHWNKASPKAPFIIRTQTTYMYDSDSGKKMDFHTHILWTLTCRNAHVCIAQVYTCSTLCTNTNTTPHTTYAFLNTEHTWKYRHTIIKNVQTYHTVGAREYYNAVLSNTLCKNMNTLHTCKCCVYTYIYTHAKHMVVKSANAHTYYDVCRHIMHTQFLTQITHKVNTSIHFTPPEYINVKWHVHTFRDRSKSNLCEV